MSATRLRSAGAHRRLPWCLGSSAVASAQTYPSKPIHLVVPISPGGITDTLARALAQRLTEASGQPVVVENQPAGAGQIGTDFVAKAAPDGYTLLVAADATFVVSPHPYSKLPVRSDQRFRPDQRARHQPAGAGGASVGAGPYARRVDRARAKKPGEINYGTFGIGTSGHLNIVLLESVTGTKFTPVHYRGATPAPHRSDRRSHPDDDREHRAGGASRRRPASSRRSASAAARGCRNIPICRPWRRAGCPVSRPARGTASPRPRALRARSSTSSAQDQRIFTDPGFRDSFLTPTSPTRSPARRRFSPNACEPTRRSGARSSGMRR